MIPASLGTPSRIKVRKSTQQQDLNNLAIFGLNLPFGHSLIAIQITTPSGVSVPGRLEPWWGHKDLDTTHHLDPVLDLVSPSFYVR
jgi:hypothetical protein